MNLKTNNNNISCVSNHSFSVLICPLTSQKSSICNSLFFKREATISSLSLSVATTTTRYAMLHQDAAVLQDIGATALLLGGGFGLVSVFDRLTNRNFISKNSCSIKARYFACIVPLVNGLRLVVHGLSLASNEGLIKSVTRDGRPEELLQGPLYYVLILALCAVLFWRESPVGLIAVAMMSGGDGVADIMGRKFGTMKLPYNQKKSWAGSISMLAFGFLISIGMLYYFSMLGYFQLDWNITAKRVALVSFTATVVESLPITELIDDNISVPFVTLLVSYICFCV